MDQTPEDRYREELKKRLTEKHVSSSLVYYSKTGFRKTVAQKEDRTHYNWTPPRRRLGLVLMLPIVFILMMSNNLRSVLIPVILGAVLYMFVKRRR